MTHEAFRRTRTAAADSAVKRVYGEAYETADGVTVIPVAKIRMGRRGRRSQQDDQDAGAFGFAAAPLGVFVVKGGAATWVPAVDANRVALIGVTTGLLAAVIASLAVLRRPPWPDVTIRDYR